MTDLPYRFSSWALDDPGNFRLWAWADRRANDILDTPFGRPVWFVNVFSDQSDKIRDLEQIGFASQANVGEDSWFKVLMHRSVDPAYLEYSLPAGFTIRPLTGAREFEGYVELHRAVFESCNMTVEFRSRIFRQPEYIPGPDLVAAAQDGRLAVFCVSWLTQGRTKIPLVRPSL